MLVSFSTPQSDTGLILQLKEILSPTEILPDNKRLACNFEDDIDYKSNLS